MNSIATLETVRPAAAAMVRVRPFAAADEPRWDQFVERCPEATFFHKSGWKRVIETSFGHCTHYLLAERFAP